MMMAGERAKALAAKQKAEARAEKLRRKNSTNPDDWGRMRQLRETYKLTAQQDPKLPWLLLASGLGALAVFIVVGFLLNSPLLWGLVGISAGLLAAMFVFVRRARKAAFRRYEGQAGSAEVAMQMLGKKWNYEPVITAARRGNSVDVIHRVVGPGGLQEIEINGQEAVFITGGWLENTRDWEPNINRDVRWTQDGLAYQLSTGGQFSCPDEPEKRCPLSDEDLIRIAESVH